MLAAAEEEEEEEEALAVVGKRGSLHGKPICFRIKYSTFLNHVLTEE